MPEQGAPGDPIPMARLQADRAHDMHDHPSTFFARYSRWIIPLVALAFPVVVYGSIVAMRSNHNDIKEWLPESFAETQEYNRFQREFTGDTYGLARWDGCTLDGPRLTKFAYA